MCTRHTPVIGLEIRQPLVVVVPLTARTGGSINGETALAAACSWMRLLLSAMISISLSLSLPPPPPTTTHYYYNDNSPTRIGSPDDASPFCHPIPRVVSCHPSGTTTTTNTATLFCSSRPGWLYKQIGGGRHFISSHSGGFHNVRHRRITMVGFVKIDCTPVIPSF